MVAKDKATLMASSSKSAFLKIHRKHSAVPPLQIFLQNILHINILLLNQSLNGSNVKQINILRLFETKKKVGGFRGHIKVEG